MPGIHPSESEPLLIARLASLDFDVVQESFTPRIIRDGIDSVAPSIRRAMDAAQRRLFLILHEYATALDFGEHLLLTPHVVRGMAPNFIPIAYLPYNVAAEVKPFAERTVAASFRGSMTSELRRHLLALAPHPALRATFSPRGGEKALAREDPRPACGERVAEGRVRGILIEDSGAFHDHLDPAARAANRDRYVDLLADSRIAICPRGAGASTFRFWEALAMGCVPLLISDGLVLPLEDRIDWDRIVLRLAEDDVERLEEVIDVPDLARRAREGHRVWQEWFSPENWIRGVSAAVTLRR